jgi:murein L,D-transpeptidase YafK
MRSIHKKAIAVLGLVTVSGAAWLALETFSSHRSVEEAAQLLGPDAVARLAPRFEQAGVTYPPRSAVLLAMKEEKQLELWAKDDDDYAYVHTYPILAASGKAGPKLREGDKQVPEGFYNVVGLNPNSSFHLSMKLDYPNEFDMHHAKLEGRDEPGSDIFIHGKAASIGCLAMGDSAIEELFALTYKIGTQNVSVIIAPRDPRKHRLVATSSMPRWTAELYRQIELAAAPYVRPE